MIIFEVVDKTGRKIRLTKNQLAHILKHQGLDQYIENIQATLKKPLKINFRDGNLADYYSYFKHKKSYKYLKVVVKCQELSS